MDKLRCHVERRTLDGGEDDSVGRHRAGKAEIAKFDDAVRRNQNVLRLHVSVDDPMTVQVVEGLDKLLGNFADLRLAKVAVILKDFEELTLSELSDHAEFVRGFKRI